MLSENDEKIKELYGIGFPAKKIAALLELNHKDVTKIIKENGFQLLHLPFTEDEIPKILKLYEEGVSAKILAIRYNIDRRRVFKFIKAAGIKQRTAAEGCRTDHWNEHIYDEVNTKEKAYWLGFFYADAYNHQKGSRFTITLAQKDYDHVVKFAEFIGKKKEDITNDSYIEDNGKIRYTSTLRLHSKYFCERMTELGCMQAKTFKITFPEWLDESIYHHFVRGYFDGDGCITHIMDGNYIQWKINIASTEAVCTFIKNYLFDKLSITSHAGKQKDANVWVLEISGNRQIARFCEWIYKDSEEHCRMTRKHNRYLQLLAKKVD